MKYEIRAKKAILNPPARPALQWILLCLTPDDFTRFGSSVFRSKHLNRTLQKPSSSATLFGTSTIYSVLTKWTLEITSTQFTRRNCNLRILPHHLLKCVIVTQISRRAVQTHLSVSASTIREMILQFGLSTFLIWTATFQPIQLTVFIGESLLTSLFTFLLISMRLT